jgi:hypothetical protein
LNLNIFAHANSDSLIPFAAPEGWSNLQLLTRMDGSDMIATFTRDDVMVMVVRGSATSADWAHDLQYEWAPAESSRAFLPGRVHKGYFSIFKEVTPLQKKKKTGCNVLCNADVHQD